MKPLALPLLVVALGTVCVSARADDPNLGAPVVFETGPLSLGARDSLIVLAREGGAGTSHLNVKFFGEDDQPVTHANVDVAPGLQAKVILPYGELDTTAPLASVWAEITLTEEFPAGSGLISASTVHLTLQVANSEPGATLTTSVVGSCTTMGPRIHGGGRDSKCVGPITIPAETDLGE